MTMDITIGTDIAKNVFHLRGAAPDFAVVFQRKLSRAKLLDFLAKQAPCLIVMEACASAHHWGREIGNFGHDVRLIPPQYVKPFMKRQKNDAADAEAIAEAASRVDAVCRREERWAASSGHGAEGARSSAGTEGPDDQCVARPSRRTWRCGAERPAQHAET
jgi:transposase